MIRLLFRARGYTLFCLSYELFCLSLPFLLIQRLYTHYDPAEAGEVTPFCPFFGIKTYLFNVTS